MPFSPLATVYQGRGPLCGAACAVYAKHWLDQNDNFGNGYASIQDEVDAAMVTTSFTSCTNNLGSTPSNIITYLKGHHPNCRIYTPTEILTNWSGRPWYFIMRLGLLSNICETSFSLGFECCNPNGIIGDDYIIIKMVSKSYPGSTIDYFSSHFVVETYNNQIMDPSIGRLIDKNIYLTGGAFSSGWKSIGLDIYVFRP